VRVALITGSAKGIGRGIAERLARDGYAVVVNYRTDSAAAAETLSLVRVHAPDSLSLQADVAQPDEARRLIEKTVEALGRLDVLVNNAGPFLVRPLVDTTVEEWRAILDGNLSSAFYCVKYAVPIMRRQKSGNIVNVGSLNVETARGATTTAAYTIAKTGLVVLTKSLARTEAAHGLRVNMINPGFIETYATTPADREEVARLVPLGALGQPEDIAEAVSFLISEKARYINGAVLNVHGGLWV